MRRIAARKKRMATGALALLGSLWMHPAFSALKYDPQSCKTDTEGRVFVQISTQLLAIPVAEFGFAEPLHAGSLRTFEPTPDPAAPQGCPDNPIQTTRYIPHLRLAAPVHGLAAAPTLEVGGFELIYVVPKPVDRLPGVVWLGASINLESLERRCKRAALREQLQNGMTACRVKPDDPTVRVEDWAASYFTPVTDYATPLGTQFVVDCFPGLYSSRIGYCSIRYSIALDLGLSYKFFPFGPGPHIAIDDILDFDKAVRAAISQYISDGHRLSRR